MNRSELPTGQPGATWGNLKTEVARSFLLCLQGVVKASGNLGNLFVSLTCGGERRSGFPRYKGGGLKVAQVAREVWKCGSGRGLGAGNLKTEVARGCPERGGRVL